MVTNSSHLLSFFIILNLLCSLGALDSLSSTQTLSNNQTLVSATNLFELGFFNPGNSDKWYIGIWYKDLTEKTVVWVANRDNPIRNAWGVLMFNEDGNLVLVDQAACVNVWTTNISNHGENRIVAKLLDTGNLVLYQENIVNSSPENFLWQSFDYPTDTLLPGMKLGWDRKAGRNRYLTSWKKPDDPSSGDYTFMLDVNGYPSAYFRKKQDIIYRSGPWNGIRFSGLPEMNPSSLINFSFKMNVDEVYYMYELRNNSLRSRLLANSSGIVERYMWIPATSRSWNLFWYAKKDQCDNYQECGNYGICNPSNSPICKCMKGFKPKNPQAWFLRDGSDGCVRESTLDCKTDGFLKLSSMKLPDSSNVFVDPRMSLDQCRETCKRNCSCMGYTNSNISYGGSGCVIWSTNLTDMRQFASSEGGQDLYIRAAVSDLEQGFQLYNHHSSRFKQLRILAGAIIPAIVLIALAVAATACILWRRKTRRVSEANNSSAQGAQGKSRDFLSIEINPTKSFNSTDGASEEFELPLFDFNTIVLATNYFSNANKVGRGGFGVVHKGILAGGELIAVKRLSKNSGQGVEEFKNELNLIAKLQHRNLVRLIGCCVDMEEKMLIYEYMENRSLDSILFSNEKSSLLNWQTRFNIILGIAKGILYLHQDSRFRIIHRDLKAGNILLDKEMEPKISDFGMARIFGCDQTEEKTKQVAGTYGYMSPEYIMDGLFSIKSDVFSFGVILLEIISGQKNNRGFYETNSNLNLLEHAWMLLRDGRGLQLLDPKAGGSFSALQVIRCIQVGLLCIQDQAEDRPTMGDVVLMLSTESISLPNPTYPSFCIGRRSHRNNEVCSINDVTITELEGR